MCSIDYKYLLNKYFIFFQNSENCENSKNKIYKIWNIYGSLTSEYIFFCFNLYQFDFEK